MKRIVSFLFCFIMLFCEGINVFAKTSKENGKDINKENEIQIYEKLNSLGCIWETNSYEGQKNVTRGEFASLLNKFLGSGISNKNNTSDMDKDNDKFYQEVQIAVEKGVMHIYDDGSFAPDKNITREQMALIIYRYAKMKNHDISGTSNLKSFTDTKDISEWALDAIKWANSVNLINGTSDNTLSPKNTTTRAQVATILMRFCEIIAK